MDKHSKLKKGSIFVILAALCFSTMSLLVKFATKTTTVDKIVAFRFGISFIYVLIVLLIRKILKKKTSLKTKHKFMHFSRAISSILAMTLLYVSLKYIPMVDANLLFMSNALFVPIIAAIFLSTKVKNKHWVAIIIGFCGVAFILKPGNEILGLYSFIGLASGLSAAISFVIVRELSQHDSSYVCMFYLFLIAFIITGSYAFLTWKTPNLYTTLLLIGAGVFGALSQEFVIRGSFHIPANIVSSLLYTSLIFTIFLEWFFINYIPHILTWIGIILVVFSSILTVYIAKSKKRNH